MLVIASAAGVTLPDLSLKWRIILIGQKGKGSVHEAFLFVVMLLLLGFKLWVHLNSESWVYFVFAALESIRETTITLGCSSSGYSSSCYMHGSVFIFGAIIPLVDFHKSFVWGLGILQKAGLSVHVWIYSTVEVLFHLVYLRSFHYNFWFWV